jgi:hypothetical protein
MATIDMWLASQTPAGRTISPFFPRHKSGYELSTRTDHSQTVINPRPRRPGRVSKQLPHVEFGRSHRPYESSLIALSYQIYALPPLENALGGGKELGIKVNIK